jgi:flagellar basal-body rod protein FlgC
MTSPIEVIARSLSVQRTRVNVLASNIANAETTRTPEGGPYRRKDIVQVASEFAPSFSSALDRMTLAAPKVAAVVEDQSAPRLAYQPGHPDANKDGYVEYPNINVVTTMTDLMTASRLYQANVVAAETVRNMARDARTLAQGA